MVMRVEPAHFLRSGSSKNTTLLLTLSSNKGYAVNIECGFEKNLAFAKE